MKFSSAFNINWTDLSKGLLMTFITTASASLFTIIHDGRMPTVAELQAAAMVGLTAGFSYLVKNFFSGIPSEIIVDTSKTVVVDKHTDEVIAGNTEEKK